MLLEDDLSVLAINGGVPVRREPLSKWPYFAEDEIQSAVEVLKSGAVNYWTGSQVREFEKEFAGYLGIPYTVALANGTVALELALKCFNVGPGDQVLVTSRSFIASASCVSFLGAEPIFADVDLDSQNVSAETLEPLITEKTKAIIVVHLAGWPCEMDPILKLAKKHGLCLIEDCAQALGARYRGRLVGTMGDIGAFSFCQDKIITTAGEGGMLVTSDAAIWERAWSFKDHGKSYALSRAKEISRGFKWLHHSIGTNWRMTEIQAAIGRGQLSKLENWLAVRRRNSSMLFECCSSIEALRVPSPPPHITHANYKYYVFVIPALLGEGWSRDRIMEALNLEGIPCMTGSCPEIYREKVFQDQAYPRLPIARELGETSLMFLIHPTLSEEEMSDTCKAIKKVFAEVCRKL